ncbi:Ldh family oxidoreductase (plasmid) [Komagataeibacter oboediens]|uniref:Ldh family oxidoreductase n=1 Tax=Komagataeibacter oboediens TaxID=65958 RepID=UPI0023DAF396|nr:Ldh family oxidoreductase [Komagataeibacter oboediens]WEQ50719.1 Ldh family oxidoreductase [Komagataeibacter oboediens]
MNEIFRASADVLTAKTRTALLDVGATPETAEATTQALLYASNIGVDSHGVRLVTHYAAMLRAGRVKTNPILKVRRTAPATAMLDADNGLGHHASYQAMKLAIEMAGQAGIGAVGVMHSSHCGAVGAYALKAAEAGMVGIVTSNSDANVTLFNGSRTFHGTNPLAMAAPVSNQMPWLLDMATSSIPFNRVRLYRSLGLPLPSDVAADAEGNITQDAMRAAMLLPLGGESYGFKGAGLAGMVTILSTVLTGAVIDPLLVQMTETSDFTTPRNVGHFCIALDPARFIGREAFDGVLKNYLALLRAVPSTVPGESVMAPGDREWKIAEERKRTGIPVDPDTQAFLQL